MTETSQSATIVKVPHAIARAWTVAAEEPLYVVTNGRVYLVEAPWERADAEAQQAIDDGREPAEAALRLFTGYEDVIRYCEQQRDERDVSSDVMHVAQVTLAALWALMPIIQANADAAYGVPVRVDLCRFTIEGRPVVIDTLVASFTTVH